MDKPEYIKNLELKDNVFSVMVCHTLKGDFLKYLSEKKLTRVYEQFDIFCSDFCHKLHLCDALVLEYNSTITISLLYSPLINIRFYNRLVNIMNMISDDFVFDNQMITQLFMKDFECGEVTCPTKYFEEASSINFKRSSIYGLGCLKTAIEYRLHRWGIIKFDYLN